jgi:uncharacterized protein
MITHYPRYIAIRVLQAYQRTISFDHGFLRVFYPFGFCRFRPTCSDYAVAAITKYGLIKGGAKAVWRVLRCHPWNKGGYDPA